MKLTKEQKEKVNNLNAGQSVKFDNTIYWVSFLGEPLNREVKE